jgi:hypothetical protein
LFEEKLNPITSCAPIIALGVSVLVGAASEMHRKPALTAIAMDLARRIVQRIVGISG